MLKRKELELNRIVPVPISQLAAEHLRDVEETQAASCLVKTSPAKSVKLLRDDSDVQSRFLTYEECLRLVKLASELRREMGMRPR